MRGLATERFLAQYNDAPPRAQKDFQKQLGFLLHDLRHPSLHAKKYDEARDICQARVNQAWRFYFRIEGDAYVLLNLVPHPK